MRQHKRHGAQPLYGKVIFWPLFLFAVTPLALATPAHAADGNTVELTIDPVASLKPLDDNANLYKATTNIIVKTGKPYGFNLTMQASTADLINTIDSNHKISAISSTTPIALGTNQWGYSLKKYDTTFSTVPTATDTPAVLVDTAAQRSKVGSRIARCKRKTNCKARVTFGANVNPSKLASGSYSTTVVYTAIVKPKPAPIPMAKLEPPIRVVNLTVCRSGDLKNDCQVDLDANMIPVKYTGTTTNARWTSLAKPEDSSNQGNWYNYNNKQWANAITVKDPSKYKGKDMVVDQADILGYWVYIPRYAYEVMRRDGTDKPVEAQNFLISFEKTTTPKRYPAACPEKDKDYRTQCGLNRDYVRGHPSNVGTWATHPAFTFGAKELNGIWFAKFETTGTTSQPTVLPNEAHISGNYIGINGIGSFYSVAKSLGVDDPQNVGGKSVSFPQNNHNLVRLSSHMVNNNDWGAATYLSFSKYGVGYNGVQINSQSDNRNNGNGDTYGTTGCGPYANGYTDSYSANRTESYITYKNISIGALGTQSACSSSNTQRAYNGAIGQLASTTNNPTGIYDMSGGGEEYVAASYSYNLNNSDTNQYFGYNAAHPPYVNTYNFKDFNSCTYQTCGGQALYEITSLLYSDDYGSAEQWDDKLAHFVVPGVPWFSRGGYFYFYNGVFHASGSTGYSVAMNAFRVALTPAPHD